MTKILLNPITGKFYIGTKLTKSNIPVKTTILSALQLVLIL